MLVSDGQLSDSGCRTSSLHRNQRIEGCRTSQHPTHPPDTSSRSSEPYYRHAAILPCASIDMPPDRTFTVAVQASALMRCHPGCSAGCRRLSSRSPHGYEQHARTTDAKDKGPALFNLMGVVSSPCTTSICPIGAAGALVRPRCKPFLTRSHWQRKNSWPQDHGRQP